MQLVRAVTESDRAKLDEDFHRRREFPLSEDELRKVRELMRNDDRQKWAVRQLKILAPAVVAIVTLCYALGAWIASHWKA